MVGDRREPNLAKRLVIELAWSWWLMPMRHVSWRPGAVVLGLPPEKREILRRLRSEDLANVRVPGR